MVSRGNSIGKKLKRLDWEKAIYQPLFMLANTLDVLFIKDDYSSHPEVSVAATEISFQGR